VLDDYLYICDDAYVREDILAMETSLLTTLEFDIGMPLSYTFLRRYAQCGRVSIPTLTLARFILESSLMDYTYVTCSESQLAAAALVLAMRMTDEGIWVGALDLWKKCIVKTGHTTRSNNCFCLLLILLVNAVWLNCNVGMCCNHKLVLCMLSSFQI